MELTASNIATCTIATTRCAAGGVMRGVTKATAFSFQSAITSAKADDAGAINATATSALRRLACILCSLLVECLGLRIAAVILRARATLMRFGDAAIQSQICIVGVEQIDRTSCEDARVSIAEGYEEGGRSVTSPEFVLVGGPPAAIMTASSEQGR